MFTILVFLVSVTLLVFAHELGHFLAARMFGVRVEEFAVGLPPRLLSKRRGGTEFSLNLLPIGGYVKILGENPQEGVALGPGDFGGKPRYARIIILLAGVVFNLLLAFLLLWGALLLGLPQALGAGESGKLKVADVLPDSPASEAGLVSGDEVTSIFDGTNKIYISTVEDFQEFVASRAGEKLSVEVKRDEQILDLEVTPDLGLVEGRAALGVSIFVYGENSFLRAPYDALLITGQMFKTVALGLFSFFGEILRSSSGWDSVTGPVGIAVLTGEAASSSFWEFLYFLAFISVNLCVINLLPFPALDGGRVLFLVLEAIRKKDFSARFHVLVNRGGLLALLILIVLVTFKDLGRFF